MVKIEILSNQIHEIFTDLINKINIKCFAVKIHHLENFLTPQTKVCIWEQKIKICRAWIQVWSAFWDYTWEKWICSKYCDNKSIYIYYKLNSFLFLENIWILTASVNILESVHEHIGQSVFSRVLFKTCQVLLSLFLLLFLNFVGLCLFLSKAKSAIEAYDCETFEYGCPESPYRGSTIFKCKNLKSLIIAYILLILSLPLLPILTFSSPTTNDLYANPH